MVSWLIIRIALVYRTVGARRKDSTMITHLSPLLSIIFGILILLIPRFLNYFVAIYLIVTGLLGLGVVRWSP
jgi:uncharacterized membrane protein HdeD (DUF308 family)